MTKHITLFVGIMWLLAACDASPPRAVVSLLVDVSGDTEPIEFTDVVLANEEGPYSVPQLTEPSVTTAGCYYTDHADEERSYTISFDYRVSVSGDPSSNGSFQDYEGFEGYLYLQDVNLTVGPGTRLNHSALTLWRGADPVTGLQVTEDTALWVGDNHEQACDYHLNHRGEQVFVDVECDHFGARTFDPTYMSMQVDVLGCTPYTSSRNLASE